MASSHRCSVFLAMLLSGAAIIQISAQNEVPWLEDYTSEMVIGTDTYRYSFSTVNGNDCKLEVKESVTDKKGSVGNRAWIFYLSDIDPSGLDFKPRGKSINVTIETVNGQKFISYYEEGELETYTDEIGLTMNDVAMSRLMLEALRDHIGPCRETEVSWNDREAAFDWLTGNIGKAVDNGTQWEQEFSRAEKPYLARLNSRSVNTKGEEGSFEYLFDLSDIDSSTVNLEVSGKSLGIEVFAREGEDLIEVNRAGGKEFTDELKIYADDVELARMMVHALSFLGESTTPERPDWDSYHAALGFVEENLGEVKIDDETFTSSISYDDSPSGTVELTVREIGSDGEAEEMTYAFYLTDMAEKPVMDASSDEVMIAMETRDDRNYIRKISGGSITGYSSNLEFHATGIDAARDIIRAFETAIRFSEEEIVPFSSVDQVNDWMEENLDQLFRGGETYEQKLLVDKENGSQIMFERKLTKEDEVTETRYLVYPADISLEKLKIGVSMGRLNVSLETTGDDYIRNFKNGGLQNYTGDVDVYFSDPLVAKNFMSAIRFLKEQADAVGTSEMSRDDAVSFLNWNIPQVEVPGIIYKQDMEIATGDECRLKFTRVGTEDGGEGDEFIYELTAQDIDVEKSKLSVIRNLIEISLVTVDGQKLIKPYENGEVEDFDDEMTIYADDVQVARKILAAFGVLSGACR